MADYLDFEGLSKYDNLLKEYLSENFALSDAKIEFIQGTGTTEGVWLGEAPSITEYKTGLTILYKPSIAGVSGGTTLNINNLGAKKCYRNNADSLTTHYPAKSVILFVYDEALNSNAGGWRALADYDSTETYSLRPYYSRFYTGENPLYSYKICGEDAQNRIQPLTLTSGTGTSKTVNTTAIKPDKFYWYSTTTTVEANKLISHGNLYLARGSSGAHYTFNGTISTYKEIYLKGTYSEETGLFTLDNSTATSWYVLVPYNTTFTASDYFQENYQYIFLGRSYSSANYMYLYPNHKMYEFNGTNLVLKSLSGLDLGEADIGWNSEEERLEIISPTSYIKSDGANLLLDGTKVNLVGGQGYAYLDLTPEYAELYSEHKENGGFSSIVLSDGAININANNGTKFNGKVDFTNVTEILGLPSNSGITELTTQEVRITDLADGIYKWTYNGEKSLYYYGETSTNKSSLGIGDAIIIVYGTRQFSDGTNYIKYYALFVEGYENSNNSRTNSIFYGYSRKSNGQIQVREFLNIPTSTAMTLLGTQTVTGNKTFTGAVDFTNATVTGLPTSGGNNFELTAEAINSALDGQQLQVGGLGIQSNGITFMAGKINEKHNEDMPYIRADSGMGGYLDVKSDGAYFNNTKLATVNDVGGGGLDLGDADISWDSENQSLNIASPQKVQIHSGVTGTALSLSPSEFFFMTPEEFSSIYATTTLLYLQNEHEETGNCASIELNDGNITYNAENTHQIICNSGTALTVAPNFIYLMSTGDLGSVYVTTTEVSLYSEHEETGNCSDIDLSDGKITYNADIAHIFNGNVDFSNATVTGLDIGGGGSSKSFTITQNDLTSSGGTFSLTSDCLTRLTEFASTIDNEIYFEWTFSSGKAYFAGTYEVGTYNGFHGFHLFSATSASEAKIMSLNLSNGTFSGNTSPLNSILYSGSSLAIIVGAISTGSSSGGSSTTNTDEMPSIRLVSNKVENKDEPISAENPLTLTVETSGQLQVGDQLQVCKRKLYTYATDVEGVRTKRYKLRRYVEYVVTEEDIAKNRNIFSITIGVGEKYTQIQEMLRSGTNGKAYPNYLRIRRTCADNPDNAKMSKLDVFTVHGKYSKDDQSTDGSIRIC